MTGILDWLIDWAGTFFKATWRFLTSYWALTFGMIALVVEFTTYLAWWMTKLSWEFVGMTYDMLPVIASTVQGGSSSALTGLGLANCVLPVDYALAAAGTLMTIFTWAVVWKGIVALYRLIPFNG